MVKRPTCANSKTQQQIIRHNFLLGHSKFIPSYLTVVALMIIIIIINNYLQSVLQLCYDEMEKQ